MNAAGIQKELTTLTLTPRISLHIIDAELNGVPVSALIYLVWSCSTSAPIWKKEHGSFSRNSRCEWNRQRLLWIILWSLAHSSWASNDTGGRSCSNLSWPDPWTSTASRRDSLDWLEEKNLDIWTRPATVCDLVWSTSAYPLWSVDGETVQLNAKETKTAFLCSLFYETPSQSCMNDS